MTWALVLLPLGTFVLGLAIGWGASNRKLWRELATTQEARRHDAAQMQQLRETVALLAAAAPDDDAFQRMLLDTASGGAD